MKISKLEQSRKQWKAKAKERGAKIRNLRKTAKRLKKKTLQDSLPLSDHEPLHRRSGENAARRSGGQNQDRKLPEASSPVMAHRTLCVIIILCGSIPFRCVPRMLAIFQPWLRFAWRIPHFTSVIHWTLRVGIALFRQVSGWSEPWVALLDCSIDIGTRKALVVLRIPLRALHQKQKALGLKDCECIGLEIAHSWNGPRVAETLGRVFETAGCPVAVLKDGGADLRKGVELFCGRQPEKKLFSIEDVGHYTANLLKAQYAGKKCFTTFLKIVATGTALIRQTNLAWLIPPKLRTKGRFQGITALAHWAHKVLALIERKPKAASAPDARKARQAFFGLARLRPFLTRFCQVCALAELFLGLLKTKGLNETTYNAAQDLLAKLPARSSLRTGWAAWLEKHITIFRALGSGAGSLPVSSDPIESLFGKFKTMIQRNPHAELNRLIYVIPLLCGEHSEAAIDRALHQCSHADMLSMIEQTVPPTLRQTRKQNLDRAPFPVPKSGDIYVHDSG
jgi:hypothetical protein